MLRFYHLLNDALLSLPSTVGRGEDAQTNFSCRKLREMMFWTEISSHFAWGSGALTSPAALEIFFHPEILFLVSLSTWTACIKPKILLEMSSSTQPLMSDRPEFVSQLCHLHLNWLLCSPSPHFPRAEAITGQTF